MSYLDDLARGFVSLGGLGAVALVIGGIVWGGFKVNDEYQEYSTRNSASIDFLVFPPEGGTGKEVSGPVIQGEGLSVNYGVNDTDKVSSASLYQNGVKIDSLEISLRGKLRAKGSHYLYTGDLEPGVYRFNVRGIDYTNNYAASFERDIEIVAKPKHKKLLDKF